ncbi:MAG TPA: alpha-galactosidase [Pseudonocardiaceae bacterium]|nr:alpha-galactosidase [Pseudonocardiaceae bacterium]
MSGLPAPRSARFRATALAGLTALLAGVLVGFATVPAAHAEANGVAASPQMGWSSWSFIRRNPTEANIEAQAKAMHDTGLVGHGYTYLNIDDFYYLNPATTVDAFGRWVTDTGRFPNGMAPVATFVHGLGEKFGMYLTPGIPVAAYQQNTPIEGTTFHARDIVTDTSHFETNYNFGNGSMYFIDYNHNPPAAQAFLNSWANELASWGVDYLKLDGVGDGDIADIQHWSQALNQTGRPIHFELSNSLDVHNGAVWQQYANGWRIEGDVECYCSSTSYPLTNWNNVAARFGDDPAWTQFAGGGGWNDLDSVEVGNGTNDGLTTDERQTQLTLWAIAAAPLVLGTDMTTMDSGDLGLLSNDEVIAVDQHGHPGHPVDRTTQQQVWTASNGDGSYTVALFNLGGSTANVTANWADVGFGGPAAVRDLWSHTDLGTSTGSFTATLNPHASRLLRVTPAAGFHYTAMRYGIVNVGSGDFLDATGGSGADVTQAAGTGGTDQQWQLVPTGDGYHRIVNVASGLLLNIPGGSTTSGTRLIQWPDDNGTNAQWRLSPTGTAYTIAGRSDGMNVDVAGTNVIQSTATGTTGQQWKLVPEPDPNTPYKLVNGVSGGRIDVNNDSTADGATVLQWQDNGRTDQQWFVRVAGGGFDTITNSNSGRLLNIPGPTTNNGAQLIQFHDDGNSNSRWQLMDAGPNQVRIASAYDGQLVDNSNGSLSDGGAVIQWPANGGANQNWTLVAAQ